MSIQLKVSPTPLLKFQYVNWRGERHIYLVSPESIAFGPYTEMGRNADAEKQWVLHATMVERDGEARTVGRRTFLLSKIEAAL